MSILKVKNVSKIYTTRFGSTKVQALSNMNFTVEQGEYVAIMGESGSGKSVFTKAFMGLTDANGAITGIAANGETVILGYIAIDNVDSPDGVTHIDGPYYKAMGGAGNLRVSTLVELPTSYLGNQVATEGGNNVDPVTPDAGDAILTEKTTKVRNGGLEASSTDVANEFAEMITTQRGYQANTRIITVTDSMLEELVNMKR